MLHTSERHSKGAEVAGTSPAEGVHIWDLPKVVCLHARPKECCNLWECIEGALRLRNNHSWYVPKLLNHKVLRVHIPHCVLCHTTEAHHPLNQAALLSFAYNSRGS